MFVANGVIGEGGFGRVLTALFTKNNNWYAIKEIKKTEIMKHKTGLIMLNGEINALKRVEHPFIVSLHFAFQDTNHLFLVMDLKTGGDLRYYLKKKLIFEERDVAFYVSCISSALNHLHCRNIIHRDVKPENIILDERGYPHLADFGVAHVQPTGEDESLTTTLASGTKQYLAPEVFTQSHIHGPESDFWSLGVVAFELLHGKRPFDKHCPIPYITYLEKALKDKKNQLKEMRLKSMSFSSNSPSTVGESCSTSSSLGNVSPVNCTNRNSGSTPQKFPVIGHTNSTDGTSRGSSIEKSGYCSSVSYTPVHTANHAVSPMTHHGLSVGIAGSFDEFSSIDTHDRDGASYSPKGSFRYGHGNNGALPMLSPKAGKSQPVFIKPMGRLSEGNESYKELSMFTERTSDGTIDDDHPTSTVTRPVLNHPPPHCSADHWLVDQGELHESLIFVLPTGNAWLGEISAECNSMLQGLFEIRPSHRLGARNIGLLKNHPFFLDNHCSNWLELQTKQFSPHFRPGKKFIKEIMENQSTIIMNNGNDLNDEFTTDEHIPLTDAQNAIFKDVRYIAPAYTEMIVTEEDYRTILVVKDKYTIEKESAKKAANAGKSPEKVIIHHRRSDIENEDCKGSPAHSSPSKSGSRSLLQRLAKSFKA